MTDTQQTLWANLKDQFVDNKKQCLILASLVALLAVVGAVRFWPGSGSEGPDEDVASAGLVDIPVDHAAQDNEGDQADVAHPILASWSDIHTMLARADLFKGPWQPARSAQNLGGSETDADGDGVPDHLDNCPHTPNPSQADTLQDGTGDACARGVPESAIDDIQLILRGTTLQQGERKASAYINSRYYKLGSTFWIERHELKLIAVEGDSAVVRDAQGRTRTLNRTPN